MLPQPLHKHSHIFLVAPFCDQPSHPWHSPGRVHKLSQVEQLLSSFKLKILRFNTAPVRCLPSDYPVIQLAYSISPLVRFFEIIINTLKFLKSTPLVNTSIAIWVYNARVTESIVAFIILLFFTQSHLYLQIEDIPSARSYNSGVLGLFDWLFLRFLSVRATKILAVSPNVGNFLHDVLHAKLNLISTLPPHLNPSYIELCRHRKQPFSSTPISIMYAGGYGYEKGVQDLLSAFVRLPCDQFNLKLAGPVTQEIVYQCSFYPNIEILGYLKIHSLYSHYLCSDILVSPHHIIRTDPYIFPFKLIEYASSGSLLFTTPMPGIDQLDLPDICIFKTTFELETKLRASHAIWKENSLFLSLLSESLRTRFSYHHVRKQLMGDLHLK